MGSPLDVSLGLGAAIALGIIQGATEFLPVSSDGHIAVGALLFGETEMPLSAVVALHVGTLLATFLVFRADVAAQLTALARGVREPRAYMASADGRLAAAIVVASIPTVAIGLGLRDHVEAWAHVPWIVGVCLLGSAVAVATTHFTGPRAVSDEVALPLLAAFLVGVVQGLAVLPGLSRSASTIACAMALGHRGPAAFRFSFLLSLPAVLGAVLLELRHPEVWSELGMNTWLGAFIAFFVGLGALYLLRGVVSRGRFWAFAIYLVPLGLTLIIWDLMHGDAP